METARVFDIATIATALNGVVDFSEIKFSQILMGEHEKPLNDLMLIGKKWGIYFYTYRSCFEALCQLTKQDFPTFVVHRDSRNVYQIKK